MSSSLSLQTLNGSVVEAVEGDAPLKFGFKTAEKQLYHFQVCVLLTGQWQLWQVYWRWGVGSFHVFPPSPLPLNSPARPMLPSSLQLTHTPNAPLFLATHSHSHCSLLLLTHPQTQRPRLLSPRLPGCLLSTPSSMHSPR